jgi:hypothetical protein
MSLGKHGFVQGANPGHPSQIHLTWQLGSCMWLQLIPLEIEVQAACAASALFQAQSNHHPNICIGFPHAHLLA